MKSQPSSVKFKVSEQAECKNNKFQSFSDSWNSILTPTQVDVFDLWRSRVPGDCIRESHICLSLTVWHYIFLEKCNSLFFGTWWRSTWKRSNSSWGMSGGKKLFLQRVLELSQELCTINYFSFDGPRRLSIAFAIWKCFTNFHNLFAISTAVDGRAILLFRLKNEKWANFHFHSWWSQLVGYTKNEDETN